MLYFIPAWYMENSWSEHESAWYRPKQVSEFDDTVKQIQLFARNHVYEYAILLLSFAPNFRHFLHRQGIYHAPYWSCFDAMQGVRTHKLKPFSFHDLGWPEGIRFVYTPFCVVAIRDSRKFAQIEFGESGNMIYVDLYQDDALVRRNLYDDRGFVSCSILFRDGVPWCEQYYDENGIWKFCRFLHDGHVEVNAKSRLYVLSWRGTDREIPYQKQRYRDIAEMIGEVTDEFLKLTGEEDLFTIAMHELHTALLERLFIRRKCILSFFGQRRELPKSEAARKMMDRAEYLVVSSSEDKEALERQFGKTYPRMEVITPYDSRVEVGASQQLHVQNVLLTIDRVSEDLFQRQILIMAAYMKKNPLVRTHLFTRRAAYNRPASVLEKIRAILKAGGFNPLWAREKTRDTAENEVDAQEEAPILFFVDQCVDEMEANRCLRQQRLLVDLQPEPDLFLQIAAMSIGLPQITAEKTPYIEDGKNGRVLRQPWQLADWLPFYLESIANWNDAMIASYDLGSHFTAKRLKEQWKTIIDYVEHSGTTTGKN